MTWEKHPSLPPLDPKHPLLRLFATLRYYGWRGNEPIRLHVDPSGCCAVTFIADHKRSKDPSILVCDMPAYMSPHHPIRIWAGKDDDDSGGRYFHIGFEDDKTFKLLRRYFLSGRRNMLHG